MSDCPGYILLDYTAYSDEVLEDIDPDEMVNIYIFDKDGICIDIKSISYGELKKVGYQLTLPITYNGNSIVVWHGNESEDYDITMDLGKSYDEFYLELETLANNSFERVPSSLWASQYQTIKYCAAITRHRIHMTRIHTEVNVWFKMRGYENGEITALNMQNYVVSIKSKDDTYHTDYNLCPDCDKVTYNNWEQVNEATEYFDCAHTGALRLMSDQECMLYIHNLEGELLYTLDLMKYMLLSKDDSSITDQRFLDLNKIWDIVLIIDEPEPDEPEIPDPPTPPTPPTPPGPGPGPKPDPKPDQGYVLVGLTINGWTIWLDNVDLNGNNN